MDSKVIEALKVIKGQCMNRMACQESEYENECEIKKWCDDYSPLLEPCNWDLSDLEKDGEE